MPHPPRSGSDEHGRHSGRTDEHRTAGGHACSDHACSDHAAGERTAGDHAAGDFTTGDPAGGARNHNTPTGESHNGKNHNGEHHRRARRNGTSRAARIGHREGSGRTATGLAETPGSAKAAGSLKQVLALRTALQEAAAGAAALVRQLKAERRQARQLRSALASLREIGPLDA